MISDFRIEAANKALEAVTGQKDLTGKLYTQEYPGTRKVGLFDLMRKVMEIGQPGRLEYYYPYDGLDGWYTHLVIKAPEGLWTAHYELPEPALYISPSLIATELTSQD